MKTFYYFSKNRLKFVEITNFYRKLIFLVLFFAALSSFFVFGAYFTLKEVINPDAEVETLQAENENLSQQLNQLFAKYKDLENQIDNLSGTSNDLRLAANLPVLTDEDRNFGYGGSIFNEINPANSDEASLLIDKLNDAYNRISAKINFEKSNYEEISQTFSSNTKLYAAIPAIRPVEGGYYGDRFGMRMHPILKIRRMHNGLDIVVNTGTKVYAPGGGTISFAGRKGGLGLTVEIDHGFGYKTVFGHLSKVYVKKYQKVTRGDLLALSGSSGRLATGPHLHYEVRHNGIALNPRNFIFDDVKLFEIINNH